MPASKQTQELSTKSNPIVTVTISEGVDDHLNVEVVFGREGVKVEQFASLVKAAWYAMLGSAAKIIAAKSGVTEDKAFDLLTD